MANFFPNIRRFAWSSTKQEKWNTTIQRSASGRVRTLTQQLLPEWTITASYPAITDDEARELLGFAALIKGAHEPFYWLDPEDYKATNMRLGKNSDGSYQAVMKQGGYVEPVDFIENVKVYVDGIIAGADSYTIDGGAIKFETAPAASAVVTADYRYYWKMQLKDDGLQISKIFDNVNKASIEMVIVR